MNMRKILLATVATLPLILSIPAFADTMSAGRGPEFSAPVSATISQEDAQSFIKGIIDQTLKTLGNKKLTTHDREIQFRAMLDADFDMPRISKFVLGRYWNVATPQEQQEYMVLLVQYIVHSYSKQFGDLGGEIIKSTGSKFENENTVSVYSQIAQEADAPISIVWRVSNKNGPYKIVDVTVEGVSLLLTYREEFGTILSENGGSISALNGLLKKKIAE
jgi:phospholipid transport system substrate-binding protein